MSDSIAHHVEMLKKKRLTLCQLQFGQRTIRLIRAVTVDGGRYNRERAIYGVGNSTLEMYYDNFTEITREVVR